MDSSETIGNLRKDLAEIEKILDWMEKSNEIHQIDIDILLKNTRHLYSNLLNLPAGGIEISKPQIVEPEPKPEPKPIPIPVPEPVMEPEWEPDSDVEPPMEDEFEPEKETDLEPGWEPYLEPEPIPQPPQPPKPPQQSQQSQPPQPPVNQPASIFADFNLPAPKNQKPPVRENNSGGSLFQPDQSLNEMYRKQKPVQDVATPIVDIPITDIWSAISINERFLFIRELFGNDPEGFKNTVTLLNSLSSYEAANKFMTDRFRWDANNQVANDFLNVVRRRFLK